ncbi:ABC transporter ATP-binding protein, partial [Enterococcus sp. S181_ASV_20]|nr:ABC transporter ATP-binding protein [Enterococcus sp. S181_ASV_20]
VLYSRKFSGPINELANIFSDLQSSIAAAERIFKLLDEDPEVQDVKNAHVFEKVHGDVRFDHVSFGYQADQPVIKDISLSLIHISE